MCTSTSSVPADVRANRAFAGDKSPDAYEKLIDRLLASSHYGGGWGRYWLDIARYAETCGYERDQVKPDVWKYRDWVIRAFNDDMPYDRFVREQLAGDEIPDRTTASVIATGFIRLGTWNDEPNDPNEYKYDRLEDMVGATTTAFLGLTVKCARCHDHKFDPIRQTDYYRVAAAFWAGFIEPSARELLGGPDAKVLGEASAFGWTDRGRDVPPIKLLKKGDPARPGPIVEPGHISAIPELDRPMAIPPTGAKSTTRRLQLANWLVDPKNPLTARVWGNRIWQFHFGQGLVRTPDNFGFNGERPTHPELLDWLASELVEGGWKTNRIHRLILLSETYQQSSLHPKQDEYARIDASNRLWWRAERRRLDAEALRDSLLFVAGQLDLDKRGGPSFAPTIPADALEGLSMKGNAWSIAAGRTESARVYIFAKRGLLASPHDVRLPGYDAAGLPYNARPPCRRNRCAAEQPVRSRAKYGVIEAEVELGNPQEQVTRAWQLALGRNPRASELKAAMRTWRNRPKCSWDGRNRPSTRSRHCATCCQRQRVHVRRLTELQMAEIYVSTDIESDGPIPGPNRC